MFRYILTLLLSVVFLTAAAQKTKTVSGEATYYAPETMSPAEARRVALERAKIQALADEFGTVISQSNTMLVSNANGDSDVQFTSLGTSDVKGEWIETIGEPEFSEELRDHLLIVTCKVKGKAREITRAQVEYVAKSLRNGTDLRFESVDFKDGDDLFFYFETPEKGYLSIYLLDETTQTVYCILPYKSDKNAAIPVLPDKKYILFSIKDAEQSLRNITDEYTLTCDNPKEFNTIYVVFSPNNINRTLGFSSRDYDKPDNISYVDFRSWLSKLLTRNPEIQLSQISLSISK